MFVKDNINSYFEQYREDGSNLDERRVSSIISNRNKGSIVNNRNKGSEP